jgi:hypothetical protein
MAKTPADGIIRSMREKGHNWITIAEYLNAQGYRTKTGKLWSNKSVCGRHHFRSTEYVKASGISNEPMTAKEHIEVVEDLHRRIVELAGLLDKERAEHGVTKRQLRRVMLDAQRERAEEVVRC